MSDTADFLTTAKNAAWTLNAEEIKRIEAIYMPGSQRYAEDLPQAHWIHGSDEGEEWCHACAEEEVARLLADNPGGDFSVDGGWGSEEDHLPYCKKCHCPLDASLTNYGAVEELEILEEHGFDPESDHDCYVLDSVVCAIGWSPPSRELSYYRSEFDLQQAIERHWQLGRLARKILQQVSGDQS